MKFATGTTTPVAKGMLFPPGSVTDAGLGETLAAYRRNVASRYRGLRGDELSEVPAGTVQVTPKVDGELWFAVKRADEVALVAPNGRVLAGGVPVVEEVAKSFGANASDGEIVAGELFAVGKGARPRVGDVAKALSSDGDPGQLAFMAFDQVCGESGAPAPEAWMERYARLIGLFGSGKRAQVVKVEAAANLDQVRARFSEWVDGGKAEGLVLRAGDGRIFKLKPLFTLDVAVVGFTQRTEDATQVRSLLMALMREDGSFQIIGTVGNMGSEDDRREMMKKLADTVVDSDYRVVASSGEMFRFVEPRIVIEVSCTDLQAENSDGLPIRQWTLSYGGESSKRWERVCPVAGASPIHPVLSRIRTDKKVARPDIRAEQLNERVLVGGLELKAQPIMLPASEIVRREVYTKVTKGELAVRKLLVWKTNKEALDRAYPAYVVHWTDFSAGRKTPLEREVRPAPTHEEAERIAAMMIENEIAKGWKRE
jgi:hypothetical protein